MTDESTRRAFVAGLAALGLLPTAARSVDARLDRDRVDVSRGDHGTTHAAVESGSPIWGSVEVGEFVDEESSISVDGYSHNDGEPERVSVRVSVGATSVSLSCSADRARELAAELTTVADYADGSRN